MFIQNDLNNPHDTMVSYPTRQYLNMDSIVSNITSGFLNDILKATATSSEVSDYQNIILPTLLSAVAKYCEFKDKILERLRVPKSQPTIKEAFDKCTRDEIAKKLSQQEVFIKDFIRMNKETSDKIDCLMKAKFVDNEPKVVEYISPLQSAHQKAREYSYVSADVVEETPNIQITITDIESQEEALNDLADEEVASELASTEQLPNGPDTPTDEEPDVEEVAHQEPDAEEVVAEQAPDGVETVEETEVATDQSPNCEETPTDANEEEDEEKPADANEPEVEEIPADANEEEVEEDDVSEEEIEVEEVEDEEQEEEVEEYTYKGKKYYVTNTTNGKIYACTADDDIGDQVGTFKNGKPIFS